SSWPARPAIPSPAASRAESGRWSTFEPVTLDSAFAGSLQTRRASSSGRFGDSIHPLSIMSLSSFSFPTTTLYGAGALAELPERLRRLGIHRPLVVTDPGLLKTEAFQKLEQTLGAGGRGQTWF